MARRDQRNLARLEADAAAETASPHHRSPPLPEHSSARPSAGAFPRPTPFPITPPTIPDHELIRRIGGGSYGDVWLARNALGAYRAVKVISRRNFEDSRPFEREFRGIQKFEPISRSHDGLVDIL